MKKHTNFYAIPKKEVIKSNNLIESSYRLTVQEQRLIYLASTKLKNRMIESNLTVTEVEGLIRSSNFDYIEIKAIEFRDEFNLNSGRIYKELTVASERLFQREIIYMSDDNTITKKRWVITCKYEQQKGRVLLQFHPDLIRDLLIFKNRFTILELENSKQIKSSYAFRFYELFKQYIGIGTRIMTLENLRFMLGLEDKEYPRYSNLKQGVLLPSIKELNANSDIFVMMEEIKNGRKVHKLKFDIKRKSNTNFCAIDEISNKTTKNQVISIDNNNQLTFIDDNENNIISNECSVINIIRDILPKSIEISVEQIKNMVDTTYDVIKDNKLDATVTSYITEKRDIISEYGKTHHIDNYYCLFLKAIKENWVSSKSSNKPNNKISNFNSFPQRDINNYHSGMSLDELENRLLYGIPTVK